MKLGMQIWKDISQAKQVQRVLTLGNFDGLHLGHQSLLKCLKSRANSLGSSACLLTFTPHPLKLLRPGGVKEIFTEKELIYQVNRENLDELILQEFTKEFSQLSPQDFLDLLIDKLAPKEFVIGYDFRFGKGGEGTKDFFKSYCEERGFPVYIMEAVLDSSKPISSTRIRDCLSTGEMKKGSKLLGYPYFLYGQVVTGDQKGSKIGFPTLNILPHEDFMLPNGVYKTSTEIKGKKYSSITNVGLAPTIRTDKIIKTIETHIYDVNLPVLTNENLKLEFFDYIRPEKKFASVDELVHQIAADISQVKANK